jgi:hypothetical protein
MRRALSLAVLLLAVGGLAFGSLAVAGSDRPSRPDRPAPVAAAPATAPAAHGGKAAHGALVREVARSFAGRLGVSVAQLREAGRAVKRAEVRRFLREGRPAKAELPAAKDRIAGRLARELGVAKADVLAAGRAELTTRLDQGVTAGVVTAAGRRTVLDCFDAPAACDLAALREVGVRAHRALAVSGARRAG